MANNIPTEKNEKIDQTQAETEAPGHQEGTISKNQVTTNTRPNQNSKDKDMENESDNKSKNSKIPIPKLVPVLPLRDIIIYPHMVIPLFVGRPKSLRAIEYSINKNIPLLLLGQKDQTTETPTANELYQVGAIGYVLQALKLPDDNLKVLMESTHRAKVLKFTEHDEILFAEIEVLEDIQAKESITELIQYVLSRFTDYTKLQGKIPPEIVGLLEKMDDYGRLADTVIAHLALKLEEKQTILATQDVKKRLETTAEFLEHEIKLLEIEETLKNRVKTQLDKTQRDFYLNEKLKAIQAELGEHESRQSDLDKLQKSIEEAGMSTEAKEKADAELAKLKTIPAMSPEATVSRNFLDWLVALPWKKKSEINKDLKKAGEILEKDHYGLEKVKERITEYLAVQNRVEKMKGAILCLVGPPGVGKTSLGQSIARATGREFVRISLGGVRDEAEIRGHRRTYIGSLPGKILQKMAKVKVHNPLFMLDEVDKMAMDFRGDPASALLEVLDPEQNHAFNDHYLEVDYDLSDVFFITTANSLDIPSPLLDRMEVIRIAGYTEDEKINIATRYLIPKQMKENGVKENELTITTGAIIEIIRYYTREAGVRNLEREIAKICRKVVKNILLNPLKTNNQVIIKQRNIEKYLGVRVFHFGLAEQKERVGQVYGLAWTEIGGDLLTIEVATVSGKGKTTCTGHLGEVMQESIQAALTVIRSRSDKLGIPKERYEKVDIHVHVPEGATPKDGPSAGIGMCTALASSLTNIPVRAEVAMTGEITLRGEVLPIGGLKEKLLAALRGGIKTVIIPEENIKDLKEIPKNILQHIEIKPVKWIDQVFELALQHKPTPLKTKPDKDKNKGKKTAAKKHAKSPKKIKRT
jgi:ATP-dependent Lon protease